MKEVNNEGIVSGAGKLARGAGKLAVGAAKLAVKGTDAAIGKDSRFMSIVNKAQEKTGKAGPVDFSKPADQRVAQTNNDQNKNKSSDYKISQIPDGVTFVGNKREVYQWDRAREFWISKNGKKVNAESGLRIYNQQQRTESVEESFADKELALLKDRLSKLL